MSDITDPEHIIHGVKIEPGTRFHFTQKNQLLGEQLTTIVEVQPYSWHGSIDLTIGAFRIPVKIVDVRLSQPESER